MQELEHQKQALQATQGAVAERTQRNSLTKTIKHFALFAALRLCGFAALRLCGFAALRLCGEFISLWMTTK
jgi:hypothetical protein